MTRRSNILCALLFSILFQSRAALAELKPDEIAIVVNRAEPQSRELATFYSKARMIPDERIIEVDLPTGDEVPFDRYDRAVVPVVREFLRSHGLESKVRCLVTMYGVPLRISDRVNGLIDNHELAELKPIQAKVAEQCVALVSQTEQSAREFDPDFKPVSSQTTIDALTQRAEFAGQSIARATRNANLAPDQREAAGRALVDAMRRFAEPVPLQAAAPSSLPRNNPPATSPATTLPVQALVERPFDPISRAQLRELARRSGGIFAYARVVQSQVEYLTPDASGAAFDSELALLWWPPFSRARWQPNLLNAHFSSQAPPNAPPTLMVMRLDAPTPQLVRDLIANSVMVEREGLKGKLVVDARGITASTTSRPAPTTPAAATAAIQNDAFGAFDERLRHLAQLARSKTQLQVVLDDKPAVLPPNSVDDVALYCGWYSVRNYVPSMKFNRGAVGYHIASFELLTLHGQGESGWVQNLMYAGVVGTVGPVAEPYLHSFPAPDEFFPLLLTGKLTLAEVYWTTTPMTSWMQTCIGDPLYRPYAKSPALKVDDLSEPIRSSVLATSP